MMTHFSLLRSLIYCTVLCFCTITAAAETHLKAPQKDCSDSHLQQHPEHVLPCYLQKSNSHYQWHLLKSVKQETTVAGKKQVVTRHNIEMTSQQWPVAPSYQPSHSLWQHRLTIYQPEKIIHDSALLYINGGRLYSETNDHLNAKQSPNDDLDFAHIAAISNSIVVDLKDVPNQFLQFNGTEPLKEDALIVWTLEEYLKAPDRNYFIPLHLPMVKAAQRAMDTAQSFMREQKLKLNHFIVAGMSKRGWTTWLTGAMDDRITAIAPMVIDILNLKAVMEHHYQSYGSWAPAVRDYRNILPRLHSKEVTQLMKIVDPISYVSNLRIPKYIITASNDDFFQPDASQHYFSDLKGERWIRVIPNIRHYIASMDKGLVTDTLASFYGAIIEQRPLPSVYWELKGEHLKVTSTVPPKYAKLWTASNKNARDFRLTTDNPGVSQFESIPVKAQCNNICRIKISLANNKENWKASFIELGFSNKPYKDMVITTRPFISPDSFPPKKQ